MDWYYMLGDTRVGPLDDQKFQAAVAAGDVLPQAYVWKAGMAQWQRYSDVAGIAPPPAEEPGSGMLLACAECGELHSTDDMVSYGQQYVCAKCKPIFFQRLKEGSALPGVKAYAGFWIRFCAYFIDWIILMVVNVALFMIAAPFLTRPQGASPFMFFGGFNAVSLVSWAFGLAYVIFFVGKYAATPGKMACGLRIERADGARVTYLRAFARYLSTIVSSLILCIGFIMIAFDDQCRGLHDRMCDTRVIRK